MYKIIKNMKLKVKSKPKVIYPFSDLDVNDGFEVPIAAAKKAYAAAHYYKTKTNPKFNFKTAVKGDKYQIKRVA